MGADTPFANDPMGLYLTSSKLSGSLLSPPNTPRNNAGRLHTNSQGKTIVLRVSWSLNRNNILQPYTGCLGAHTALKKKKNSDGNPRKSRSF